MFQNQAFDYLTGRGGPGVMPLKPAVMLSTSPYHSNDKITLDEVERIVN